MVERQDIDALLISALYGELTPADEARLTAHLESHPTDRSALEDLRGTREKLQQSRILAFQYEPPQSVSALLMQEASRRAPKRAPDGEGWFARFVRSFIQHPAMAAAAMLVVVVGASALVSRTGNKFADTPAVETATTDESGATIAMESPPASTPTPTADPVAAPTAGADQFKVDLVGGELEAASADKNAEGKAEAKASPETDPSVGFYTSNNKGGDKLAKPDTGLELRRRDPGPKDLDDTTTTRSVAPSEQKPKKTPEGAKVAVDSAPADEVSLDRGFADGRSSAVGGASRGDGAPGTAAPTTPTTTAQQGPRPAPRANAPRTTPPPPPPAPLRQEIATDAAREAQSRDQEKQKSADKATNDPNLAWAKDQHSALVSAVRANNCGRAANIALAIANRAPGYYAQNVETDRSVKECIAYINNEREKDAEMRASRAKKSQLKAAEPSAPKRAADQPARATESK